MSSEDRLQIALYSVVLSMDALWWAARSPT
jgi:hypothetical protein